MKILLAVDDSPYSEEVVETACHRLWPQDTEFKVLSVIEPLDFEPCDCQCETKENLLAILKKRHNSLEEHCERIRHRIEKAVPDSRVHFSVLSGKPSKVIVKSAVEWGADRILIGARGTRVCPHNLPGSVSRAVANHAHCTVEVVRLHSRVSAALKDKVAQAS